MCQLDCTLLGNARAKQQTTLMIAEPKSLDHKAQHSGEVVVYPLIDYTPTAWLYLGFSQ